MRRKGCGVALLLPGDEVRRAGGAREAAQIWDVNTPMADGKPCQLRASKLVRLGPRCRQPRDLAVNLVTWAAAG